MLYLLNAIARVNKNFGSLENSAYPLQIYQISLTGEVNSVYSIAIKLLTKTSAE
ncbi:hypothetical protein [Nostoc punctiforme]|uniref:hypothetical protein n=1 Tax=Nostoc punctiforme TaxID=272131 RepID=UPI0002E5669A|nr:hypothetical protein [Nostoc punctiforme]